MIQCIAHSAALRWSAAVVSTKATTPGSLLLVSLGSDVWTRRFQFRLSWGYFSPRQHMHTCMQSCVGSACTAEVSAVPSTTNRFRTAQCADWCFPFLNLSKQTFVSPNVTNRFPPPNWGFSLIRQSAFAINEKQARFLLAVSLPFIVVIVALQTSRELCTSARVRRPPAAHSTNFGLLLCGNRFRTVSARVHLCARSLRIRCSDDFGEPVFSALEPLSKKDYLW